MTAHPTDKPPYRMSDAPVETPTRAPEVVTAAQSLDRVVWALRTERDEIASLERRLKAARARRKLLIAKLRRAGWTLRQIEPHAGISNAAISQQEADSRGLWPK